MLVLVYQKIAENIFNCDACPTRCDGRSKREYRFGSDADFSERYEQKIIDSINNRTPYEAKKSPQNHYPDIAVSHPQTGEQFYLEVKVQQRTFMSVKRELPQSDLVPSETMALNLSDLTRYFELFRQDNIRIFIVWVLLNRPCITGESEELYYYQSLPLLAGVYERYQTKRRFRRKSGEGDFVNGIHLGVTVNYHFSLHELKRWSFFGTVQ